jgi:rRNA processing protein Krr1/Pno1
VPQNRLTPLKENWMKLYQPVTEHMQLDMRMNLKTKRVRHCSGQTSTDMNAVLHVLRNAVVEVARPESQMRDQSYS